MKKLVSTFLALAMCMALAIPAMAADYGSQTVTDCFDQTLSFSSARAETREITFDWFGDISKSTEAVLVVQPGSTVIAKDSSGNEVGFSYTAYGKENGAYVPLDGLSPYFGDGCIDYPKVDALFGQQEGWSIPVEMVSITTSFDPATGNRSELYIVLGDASPAPTQPEKPAAPVFTDVAEKDYFYKPVQWAVANNITSGTSATTFSPNQDCTRAQIIMFLWKAAGAPEPTITETTFRDVTDPNAYYYKSILWAQETGIIGGGRFAPDDPCTRAFAMYFIWKAKDGPEAQQAPFTDMPQDPGFVSAINWAVANGITSGTSATTFSPDMTCTRGQIMTFLYKTFTM